MSNMLPVIHMVHGCTVFRGTLTWNVIPPTGNLSRSHPMIDYLLLIIGVVIWVKYLC